MRVLLVMGYAREGGVGRRLGDDLILTAQSLGHEVRVHDLVRDGFDPMLHLPAGDATPTRESSRGLARRYQEDVEWMEALLVVHPVWWFAPPALLKGWIDQVFIEDVAFALEGDDGVRPLLTDRRLLVVQTFKATREVDAGPMQSISWKFWKRIVAPACGFSAVKRHAVYRVQGLSPSREERVKRRLRESLATWLRSDDPGRTG